jgi:hypothetical protein
VLSDILGIPYWTGALALAALCAAILVLLEHVFPSSDEVGPNVDGDLPTRAGKVRQIGTVPAE